MGKISGPVNPKRLRLVPDAKAAEARMQLGTTSVDNQMQEIEREAMDMQLQDKLLQYKKEMGLLPGDATGAPQALPAQGETTSQQ